MIIDLIFLLLWPRYLTYGEHLVDPTVVLKHLLIDSIWIYLHFHSTLSLSFMLLGLALYCCLATLSILTNWMLFVSTATWMPTMLPKRLAEDAEFANDIALQAELLREVLCSMKSAAVWAGVALIALILEECARALKRRWGRRAGVAVAEQRVGERDGADLSDETSQEGDSN